MSLYIGTKSKRFTIRTTDEESERLFCELIGRILCLEAAPNRECDCEKCSAPVNEATHTPEHPKTVESERPGAPVVLPKYVPSSNSGYTGFLYLRCPICGNEWGFNAREPRIDCTCRSCEAYFPLKDLKKASFQCKCGRSFRYLTNITSPTFDISCLDCGTPNSLEYIPQIDCYKGMKVDET